MRISSLIQICSVLLSTHVRGSPSSSYAQTDAVGPARDRRLTYIVCICSGAAVGALMFKYEAHAIYLAAAIKLLILVSLFFNEPLEVSEPETKKLSPASTLAIDEANKEIAA